MHSGKGKKSHASYLPEGWVKLVSGAKRQLELCPPLEGLPRDPCDEGDNSPKMPAAAATPPKGSVVGIQTSVPVWPTPSPSVAQGQLQCPAGRGGGHEDEKGGGDVEGKGQVSVGRGLGRAST